MRLVQWSSQERVDVPDITAMSFLTLGEFRRLVRTVLLGEEAVYVGRGFAVSVAAVPDTTVTVKMDPGGGAPVGFLVGAENPGTLEFGQIVGEKDSNGALEGAAQQVLDFAGQPVGTYTVEARFAYSDGATDNRAFWNEGTDTEFVASTPTRHMPTWAAQYVLVATGGEWVPLAEVAWDGVGPIDVMSITDLRNFVFEGQTPFERTAYAGTGGLPDFSRSATRKDPTIGLHGLYKIVRALARQVQDLKGHDQSGKLNWYGRIVKPIATTDPQTKSLRSVDLVTFTVGDGVTEFGDFFGADGLDGCLAHIVTNSASLPERIVIVLKSRETAAFSFNLGGAAGTARTITGKYVEIVGMVGGLNDGADSEGMIRLSANNFAAAATCLTVTGTGSGLVLRNIYINTPTNDVTLFSAARNFQLHNCNIRAKTTASASGAVCKVSQTDKLRFVGCHLEGRILIWGGSSHEEGGIIENCEFDNVAVQLNDGVASVAQNVTFRQCAFEGTDFDNTEGMIDARGVRHVNFSDCRFTPASRDHDGIRLGVFDTVATQNVKIRGCFFQELTGGSHAIDGGVNGPLGTGWMIFCDGNDETDQMRDVVVADCTFRGGGSGSIDAGGIFIREGRQFRVTDCTFREFRAASEASSRAWLVAVQNSGVPGTPGVTVRGCFFGAWAGGASTRKEVGLRLASVSYAIISDCTFDGTESDGTDVTSRPGGGALGLVSACSFVQVHNNIFHRWGPEAALSSPGECIFPLADASTHCVFAGNLFDDCGYAPIDLAAVGSANACSFFGNVFRNTSATANGPAGITSDGAESTYVGNVFDFNDAGGEPQAIALGAGATGSCIYGNSGRAATIEIADGGPDISGCPDAGVGEVPGSPDSDNRNNVKRYT